MSFNDKTQQDVWWEAYLTALAGFTRNPSTDIPKDVSDLAKEHADAALLECTSKWPDWAKRS
jgi:hypothetical protein